MKAVMLMEFVKTYYIDKALDVARGQTARWIREGRIKDVYKTSIGGHYRIPKDVADDFIKSCRPKPVEEYEKER